MQLLKTHNMKFFVELFYRIMDDPVQIETLKSQIYHYQRKYESLKHNFDNISEDFDQSDSIKKILQGKIYRLTRELFVLFIYQMTNGFKQYFDYFFRDTIKENEKSLEKENEHLKDQLETITRNLENTRSNLKNIERENKSLIEKLEKAELEVRSFFFFSITINNSVGIMNIFIRVKLTASNSIHALLKSDMEGRFTI